MSYWDNKEALYIQMAGQAMVVSWVGGASATCLVYDYVITLGQEINMWRTTSFTPATLLFFLNRYLVSFMLLFNCIVSRVKHLPPDFCTFYLRWLTVATTVQTTVVQGILVLRVWALYRSNKPILFTSIGIYIMGVGVLVGLVVIDYVKEQVQVVRHFMQLPGCYANSVPSIIAGFWITPVLVETVLFSLIISKAIVWWKKGERIPAILFYLARDSTMYFAIIVGLLVTNLFVFEFGPAFLSNLMVTPVNVAGCVLGSRLLLNLRSLSDPRSPHFSSTESIPRYRNFQTQSTYPTAFTTIPPESTSQSPSSIVYDSGTGECSNSE